MKLQNTLVMAPLGLTVSAIAVQSAHATASAQSRYIITELGTLANAINNRGQVAGTSQVLNTNDYHAFLYTNGRMLDLGTLPGTSSSEAFGINDHGAVCGVSDKVDGEGNVLV